MSGKQKILEGFLKLGKKHANEREKWQKRGSFGFQRGDKLKKESRARMSCLQGVYREKVTRLGGRKWGSYREEKGRETKRKNFLEEITTVLIVWVLFYQSMHRTCSKCVRWNCPYEQENLYLSKTHTPVLCPSACACTGLFAHKS